MSTSTSEDPRSGVFQLQFIELSGLGWRYVNGGPQFKTMYPTTEWHHLWFRRDAKFHAILTESKPSRVGFSGESFTVVDSVFVFETLQEAQEASKSHYKAMLNITDLNAKAKAELKFITKLAEQLTYHPESINFNLIKSVKETLEELQPKPACGGDTHKCPFLEM